MRIVILSVLTALILLPWSIAPAAGQNQPRSYEEMSAELQSLPEAERTAWFEALTPEERDFFAKEIGEEIDRKKAANDMVGAGYDAAKVGDHKTVVDLLTQALDSGEIVPSVLPGVYAYRGRAYRFLGKHEQAIADLTEALRLNPSLGAAVHGHRAPAYVALGRLDEALVEYGKAIDAEPDFPGNYVDRGNLWVRLGDPDRAVADFDRAIAIDPNSALAAWTKGLWLKEQGDYAQAEPLFSRAIELAPDVYVSWIDRAIARYELGQYDLAIADANRAIALNGADVSPYFWRALALGSKENLEAAIADLDHIITVATRNPDVASYDLERPRLSATEIRATLKILLNDYAGAKADLDWILEQGETAYSLFDRGQVLFQLQQDQAAAADFSRVIELEPNNKEAYRQRAFVYIQNHVYEEAISDLSKVIDLGGDPPEKATWVYAARGLAHAELNKPEQGLSDVNKAVKLVPAYGYAHAVRGTVLRYLGRVEEARAAYEEALGLDANQAIAQFGMATIILNVERSQALALSYLERALALDPSDDRVRNSLAWLHATSHDLTMLDPGKAVEHAEAVISRNPHPMYRDTLAAAYAADGQFDRAVAEAEQAIADAKNSGMTDILPELESHLALFKDGKPVREPTN